MSLIIFYQIIYNDCILVHIFFYLKKKNVNSDQFIAFYYRFYSWLQVMPGICDVLISSGISKICGLICLGR